MRKLAGGTFFARLHTTQGGIVVHPLSAETIADIAVAAAAAFTVSAAALLKWATLPVLVAYQLGRRVERMRYGRKEAARRGVAVPAQR
jgi:hypothetical protein